VEKKPRPKVVAGGKTVRVLTGCGNMYVTVNRDEGEVFEVFAALGKAGSCAKCQSEAVTRLITLALRYRVPLEEIVDQLIGLRCPCPVLYPEDEQTLSCPDAIARVLKLELGGEDVRQNYESSSCS